MKLHIFAAKHKVNAYSEKLFPSDDCVSIRSWPPVKLWRHVKHKNISSEYLMSRAVPSGWGVGASTHHFLENGR